MAKFHINSKGETGKCHAKQGGCPFGGESDHYPSAVIARQAFENSMNEQAPARSLRSVEPIDGSMIGLIDRKPSDETRKLNHIVLRNAMLITTGALRKGIAVTPEVESAFFEAAVKTTAIQTGIAEDKIKWAHELVQGRS